MKFDQSSSPETPSWMNKTTMSEGVFQVDRRDEASKKKMYLQKHGHVA